MIRSPMEPSLPSNLCPLADRASRAAVERASALFADSLLAACLDAVPVFVTVLNRSRQIVFANASLAGFLQLGSREVIYGQRPGEALDCTHSGDGPDGCGTSELCQVCGADRAIDRALRGSAEVQEFRITRRNGSSLDLRVWATPLQYQGDWFAVAVFADVSHEKRRGALERVFFHDILNTASALSWGLQSLQTGSPGADPGALSLLQRTARELIEEIQGQRTLGAAEDGELTPVPVAVSGRAVLQEAVELYRGHRVAAGRRLELDPGATETPLVTDPLLLKRVLGNLIKNALEACRPGEAVTAGCGPVQSHGVEFWVHNPGGIPREVQLQLFQRSFSTKGAGRGLGTYSIRLLTEKYLRGEVSFSSSREDGTTFRVRCPRDLSA
ncbi:MAG: PAS domain-containing sensor histidine kinase [Candidatus Latescibacterota bacterium]